MPSNFPIEGQSGSRSGQNGGGAWPRPVTGRMVLFSLIGFFAVVFAVNGVMVHEALSTFGGTETASAYAAGRKFEQDVALAKAQDERHWQVTASIARSPQGTQLQIVARDAAGHPLTGLTASALFERPTDSRFDRRSAVLEIAAGRFQGAAPLLPGAWDLVIELSRDGERLFRSRNRIVWN